MPARNGACPAREIENILIGVKDGFERKLEIQGVGYRAAMQGKNLQLSLGFSHEVIYEAPEGVTLACPKPTEISVTGIDRQKVGQGRRRDPRVSPAGAVQGQGRALRRREVFRKEGKKK